jgi:hypothetical protein
MGVLVNWKLKIEKLRTIVLSGCAIEAAPPGMLAVFDAWRDRRRGKLSDDDVATIIASSPPFEAMMWEPYTDRRGEPDNLYGWTFQATMYGVGEQLQPWWLVMARRPKLPNEKEQAVIKNAMKLLGCHDPDRDHIQTIPFGVEDGGVMEIWSWFHTGPLLEVHITSTPAQKGMGGMRVVREGTPVAPGYERLERVSRSANAKR